CFFFSSRRRHTRSKRDWSSDVCSSDLLVVRAHDVKSGFVYKDERMTVTAFRVPHGQWPEAFGYRFDTPGKSVVISGDTSPSEEIVAHCQPCDVLIHETYSPESVLIMPDYKTYRAKYHT